MVPIAAAKTTVQADTGGNGAVYGVGIAALGIAAAAGLFFYLQSAKTKAPETPKAQVTEVAADPEQKKQAEESPQAPTAATAEPDDGSIDLNELSDASATPTAEPAIGPGASTGGAAIAKIDDPKNAPPKIERVNPDGTLEDEMKKHGDANAKPGAEPASEDVRPKNVPDQPAQGAVTSAVGGVMGGARACVSGADDVSRATITFGSSGAVQSVSVSGWAAGKPAASCIQGALKGANVGPFSKPTFAFGVTIRP